MTAQISESFVISAATAGELMTHNPISVAETATVREAAALLTQRDISGVPVIDKAGRPVGLLSLADIVRYESERKDFLPRARDKYQRASHHLPDGEKIGEGYHVEDCPTETVSEIMTPVLFTVTPSTTAAKVIGKMAALKIHRVLVVDYDATVIGIITSGDILRRLALA